MRRSDVLTAHQELGDEATPSASLHPTHRWVAEIARDCRRVTGACAVEVLDDAGERCFADSDGRLIEPDDDVITVTHAITLNGRAVGSFRVRGFSDELRRTDVIAAYVRHLALAVEMREAAASRELRAQHWDLASAVDQLEGTSHDIRDIARGLTADIAPLLRAEIVAVMFNDPDSDRMRFLPGTFESEVWSSHQVPIDDVESATGRVFRTGTPYLSEHAIDDQGVVTAWMAEQSISNLVTVPIVAHGRTLGVIHVWNIEGGPKAADVERALALADRCGALLRNAWEHLRALRLRSMEAPILKISFAIASGGDPAGYFPPAIATLGSAMQVDAIVVSINGFLELRSRSVPTSAAFFDLAGNVGAAEEVRQQLGKPESVGRPGWAGVQVPVRLGARHIGGILAFRDQAEVFTAPEVRMLEGLASLSALAYASEHYHQQRTQMARLEERNRIADDLHDHVAQLLFEAQVQLDAIVERPDLDARVQSSVAVGASLVGRADEALRAVIEHWSTSVGGSIDDRLQAVAAEVESAFGLGPEVRIDPIASARVTAMSPQIQDLTVRAAREGLTNTAKHAGPCRAVVDLLRDDASIMLSVRDDGSGMTDPIPDHHGLRSLRRSVDASGGTLLVESLSPSGTLVMLRWPLS